MRRRIRGELAHQLLHYLGETLLKLWKPCRVNIHVLIAEIRPGLCWREEEGVKQAFEEQHTVLHRERLALLGGLRRKVAVTLADLVPLDLDESPLQQQRFHVLGQARAGLGLLAALSR